MRIPSASIARHRTGHRVGKIVVLLVLGLLSCGSLSHAEGQANVLGSNKLPDNWPADAPTYPDGTINFSGYSNNGGNGGAIALLMDTPDDLQKVVGFYKKVLAEKGWKIASEAGIAGTVILGAEKGNVKYSIAMTWAGDRTQISSGIENQ